MEKYRDSTQKSPVHPLTFGNDICSCATKPTEKSTLWGRCRFMGLKYCSRMLTDHTRLPGYPIGWQSQRRLAGSPDPRLSVTPRLSVDTQQRANCGHWCNVDITNPSRWLPTVIYVLSNWILSMGRFSTPFHARPHIHNWLRSLISMQCLYTRRQCVKTVAITLVNSTSASAD